MIVYGHRTKTVNNNKSKSKDVDIPNGHRNDLDVVIE